MPKNKGKSRAELGDHWNWQHYWNESWK
jgi:hypothetical protein